MKRTAKKFSQYKKNEIINIKERYRRRALTLFQTHYRITNSESEAELLTNNDVDEEIAIEDRANTLKKEEKQEIEEVVGEDMEAYLDWLTDGGTLDNDDESYIEEQSLAELGPEARESLVEAEK